MKTYTVSWRQTFDTRLEYEFEASSLKAAINKARKFSKKITYPEDAELISSCCPDTFGGDDFYAEESK